MKLPANAQEWVHWLELGPGARWLARGAALLGLGLFSLLVAYKQFRGPSSELVFLQADVGRQLAAGQGFATRVNYPQTAAYLRARGEPYDPRVLFPELSQPPLYALAVAAVLRLWPEASLRAAPVPPAGFGGDYALLVLNVACLWIAAVQTWRLGTRLFDARAGLLAALALLLSAPVWQQTVAVGGTPLMMVALLGLFQLLLRFEEAAEAGRPAWPWLAASGAVCGVLFLGEYTAGALAPLVAAYAGWRCRRWRAAGPVLAGFALVAAPWMIRNVAWTGSPVGLAWHDVALRAGDSTADPAGLRTTLGATAPAVDFRKLGNKGLTAVQAALGGELWSGGGLVLTAFFVAGWLYRFRSAAANRLRALLTLALALLVVAQAFLNSGESERHPLAYGAPLIIVFGAGFFAVLVASSQALAGRGTLAAAGLLALQAVPLGQDVLEPRSVHFHYPPYHPGLFVALRGEFERRGATAPEWMTDVPAGAAWYSGLRVWAQPAVLRDFYALSIDYPLVALVLTPRTFERPLFAELAESSQAASRFGEWGRIYAGLLRQRLPPEFPLGQPQRLADNFYVLTDPTRFPGK